MSISSSALLVELNISVWTAQRVDRGTTDKVARDNNAASDAGQFRKNLMAGTSVRKAIADYAAQCRTWHNGRTLPWSDKGTRLIPTSMLLDYKQQSNERKDHFEAMVANFLAEYPTLVQKAEENLGALFDPSDYPSAEEVASKFCYKLVFLPVPESGDFRLDVSTDELADLRQQYDAAYESRVAEAMETAWNKLHDHLRNMSEKLTEPEGERGKLFHSTFVTNAQELCSLLTHLNITKDPKLEEARRGLERIIAGVDVEDVRADIGFRHDMKGRVDEILSKFDW